MVPHVCCVKILIESDAALSQNKTFEAGQHKKAFFLLRQKNLKNELFWNTQLLDSLVNV